MPIPVPSIEKVKQNYKEATASALAQRKYKENVFVLTLQLFTFNFITIWYSILFYQ